MKKADQPARKKARHSCVATLHEKGGHRNAKKAGPRSGGSFPETVQLCALQEKIKMSL